MTVNKAMNNMLTSAAVGMIAGTAVYMMNGRRGSNVRKMRKSAAKTVKAVGSIANGISSIMH